VPANRRRGRPQGKCHRKQTARARPIRASRLAPRARAKRCGKSAPRPWQQGRHGKPHREQDRIGAAAMSRLKPAMIAGTFPSRRPGWSREAHREMRPRGMAVQPRKGWTEPGLQAVWRFSAADRSRPKSFRLKPARPKQPRPKWVRSRRPGNVPQDCPQERMTNFIDRQNPPGENRAVAGKCLTKPGNFRSIRPT
jgi:hypothetical protein